MIRQWRALVLVLALVSAVPGFAQWSTEPQPWTQAQGQGYGPNYILDGTRFVVLLDDKLETSKLKEGKQFKAKLGEDLTAPNGSVIPRGKKMKGHISSVGGGLHARMLLSFDQIETKHGWVPIAATVTGIPGEHSLKANNEGEIEKASMNKKRTAEGVVAGAAAGAGAGAAAGGARGALIGAAAGAAIGGTAAVLTDRNMTLNKGQQLELQLDRPLQVPSH
jgi:hypothetical protein